jgi:small subunit ribosomal protein S27e
MPLARDLLHPSIEEERRKHKKKRLVQSPNSYFMDVKCPGCYKITTGKFSFIIVKLHFPDIFLFV